MTYFKFTQTSGNDLWLGGDHILGFSPSTQTQQGFEKVKSQIFTSDGEYWNVRETVEEIISTLKGGVILCQKHSL